MLLVAFWYPNISGFDNYQINFTKRSQVHDIFKRNGYHKATSHISGQFPIKSLLNYFAPKGHKYTQKLQTAKSRMQLIFIYSPYDSLSKTLSNDIYMYNDFEYITISNQFLIF